PVSACDGTTTFPDEAALAAPYASYSRTVRVTNCGTPPGCALVVDAGLRQITVSVRYRPMTGVGPAAAGTFKTATVTMYASQRCAPRAGARERTWLHAGRAADLGARAPSPSISLTPGRAKAVRITSQARARAGGAFSRDYLAVCPRPAARMLSTRAY